MKLVPHLTFDGNCKEAFEFYRDLLDGSLSMTSFGESPAANQVPEEWRDRIVHATLSLERSEIAGADVSPEEFKKIEGFFLLLEPENQIEAVKLFQALSENADVQIPLQEMFWSVAYASLVDKFGIPWEISCVEAPGKVVKLELDQHITIKSKRRRYAAYY
jgi:PhnB protein